MEFEFKENSSDGTDASPVDLNLRFRHAGDLTGEPPTRAVSAHFDLWNVNHS